MNSQTIAITLVKLSAVGLLSQLTRLMISRYSALQSRPPARRASADIASLFQVSGTQPVVGSEAPKGLASQRPWTAFSALDVDPATPAHRRLATNAERQAEFLLIIDLVSRPFETPA